MRCVLQRVREASVWIEGKLYSSIGSGLLVFVAVHQDDTLEALEWMSRKISSIRIFNDDENKMNFNLKDTGGDCLVVSQFTLFARVQKGNRPSYIDAAEPQKAKLYLDDFVGMIQNQIPMNNLQKGIFAADMGIKLINDGPVTIIVDSP